MLRKNKKQGKIDTHSRQHCSDVEVGIIKKADERDGHVC